MMAYPLDSTWLECALCNLKCCMMTVKRSQPTDQVGACKFMINLVDCALSTFARWGSRQPACETA